MRGEDPRRRPSLVGAVRGRAAVAHEGPHAGGDAGGGQAARPPPRGAAAHRQAKLPGESKDDVCVSINIIIIEGIPFY